MDLSKLDVVPYPHPALRWIAKPVSKVTPLVQDVVRRMIELMHDYKGIGLAATQVAIPWRIFVTCVNDKEMVFINPVITPGKNERDKDLKKVGDFESCLSFPGLQIEEKVFRYRDVRISALDIDGKPFTISGPGMFARVVQHETDHLNSIIFIDHLKLDGYVKMGKDVVSMKFYVDSWLNYLKVQYEFQINSEKPQYCNDEQEKQKLIALEQMVAENVA